MKKKIILGIESSCDDTGVAVVEAHSDGSFGVLANSITAQNHTETSGVVPEVAARHHAIAIIPTIEQALQEAKKSLEAIDVIAVTRGPGLIGCLLVGVETAKSIAATRNIPIIGINHMEAHIASTFVDHPQIEFPVVSLLVSGGHTMVVKMNTASDYELLGTTRDDAAGEAFDKVARMLGLPYPGGPEISRIAEGGDAFAYDFPKPMLKDKNYDFSFAGLKTAVLYHIRGKSGGGSIQSKESASLSNQEKADIAASFQESVIQVLVTKVHKAAKEYDAKTVLLGGGVSANKTLQLRLQHVITTELPGTQVVIPSSGLFTDNGAMIAVAAGPRALREEYDKWQEVRVDPRLKIGV